MRTDFVPPTRRRRLALTLSAAALVSGLVTAGAGTPAHAATVPFDPIVSSAPIEGYVHNTQVTSGYARDVCFGSLRNGTLAAYNYLDAMFGWVTPGTLYTCREMINSNCDGTVVNPLTNPNFYSNNCWSNHAQGRAIDLMVGGNAPAPGPLANGNSLVDWLLHADAGGNKHARARRLGVQQILWNDRCWSSQSSGDRNVTTASAMRFCNSDHFNHVHLDLTLAGADGLTSAYGGGSPSLGRRVDFNGDGRADIFGRHANDHNLYLYAGTASGGISNGVQIGNGWDGFDTLFSPGDFNGDGKTDIIGRSSANHQLYLYTGNGSGGFSGSSVIGTGWESFDIVFSPGDFTGDGKADVIGRHITDHRLWVYAGNGIGGFSSATQVGSGWDGLDAIFSPGDFNGDGKADIIGRSAADDNLYLYAGTGTGGITNGMQIGNGWGSFDILFSPGDFNGDGRADIIGRHSGDHTLYVYTGNGSAGFSSFYQIGSGWNSLDAIF